MWGIAKGVTGLLSKPIAGVAGAVGHLGLALEVALNKPSEVLKVE